MLMTIPQTAKLLGISEKTVRNWVYRREIPFIKLNGRLVRIRMTDIELWLKAQTVEVK